MEEFNPESPTEARDGDGSWQAATSTESKELSIDSNSSTVADQESDVILSLNAVSIVEEDFLATIPMPDTMLSGIIPPEALVPKKEKKKKDMLLPVPPPPTPPSSPPPPPPVSNTSLNLIETEEKVPIIQDNSCSSPVTATVSPDDQVEEKRPTSRWDRSIVAPKPLVRTPNPSSVTKIAITTTFEKSPMKTSPISPTVVMAKGVKRGITFGKNLGFRTSYQGIAFRLSGQSSNGEDPNSDSHNIQNVYSSVSENGTVSSAVSTTQQEVDTLQVQGIGVFGPRAVSTDETDSTLADCYDGLENVENETECSSDNKGSKELRNFMELYPPVDEPPASDATPKSEFRKFKFLLNNGTDASIVCDGNIILPPPPPPARVPTVGSSVGEDSNSCGATMPPSSSAANSETDVSTPTDTQSESSSRDTTSVDYKQSPRRPGRRRRESPHYRSSGDSYRDERRRSSRIRSIEERRERERERDDSDERPSYRRRTTKVRKDRYSRGSRYDKRAASPVYSDNDRNVRRESKAAETKLSSVYLPTSAIECNISPHLIPLPPMPPPPPRPVSFNSTPSSVPYRHPNSLSPIGGGDDFSGKPEKVKSRWRRNSELERVCTVPPPSSSVPNFVSPNMLPFPTEARNHYELGGKSVSQRFYNNVPYSGTYCNPSSLAPSHLTDGSIPVNQTSNSHSIVPVLKGPPPPPPPVCGFFDEGEVTEDWSEKEVTSSLTKNPLPLRPRVVNHVVATPEADRVADVVVSKPNSLPKSSSAVAAVPVPKEKPAHINFEEITENIYLSERRRSKSKREVRRMVCDCTITKEEIDQDFVACGDDCLNRLLMMECGSRCPTGEHCTNRRFQKKEYAKIEVLKTEKKGWGLKTEEELPSGSFVLEYVGEVLDQREFKKRVKEYAHERHRHYYFMALRSDEIIDATQKGNFSRFINHSCDPNCETQKWTVNGELRVGFFTRRLIPAGDELTFDYQFQRYGKEAQKCFCEAANCRGLIGGDKQTPLKKDRRDVKKKKSFEERRREELEDIFLEQEIDKLNQLGGLKNRAQVLNLCRLMVRAEETEFRLVLLNSLQKTNEQACLRLFLDYHGLSLLWSWMVDIGIGDDMLPLKSEILKTLQKLPISNKNVLTDSKVMPVVQRWVLQIAEYLASQKAKADSIADDFSIPVTSKENGLTTEDSSSDGDSLQPKLDDVVDAKDVDAKVCSDESSVIGSNSIDNVDNKIEDNDNADDKIDINDSLNEKTEINDNIDDKIKVNDTIDDVDKIKVNDNRDDQEDVSDKTGDVSTDEGDKLASVPEMEDKDILMESDKENDDDLSIEEKIMQMEGEAEISQEKKDDENVDPQPSIGKMEPCVSDAEGSLLPSPSSPNQLQLDVKLEIRDTAREAGEIASLASELLSFWGNLKEVYRIPKREQNQNRHEHEREADEQESSDEKDKDYDRDRRERTWDRDGDRRDRDRDGDGRYDRFRDKHDRHDDRHRNNNDYDRGPRSKSGRDSPSERDRRGKRDRWRGDDDEPERKRHGDGSASNKLSKLQRRREFELKVQQEEEEAIRRQHEEYYRQQQEAQMMALDPMYYDPNYCHVPFYDPATGYPIPAVPIATPDPMAIMAAMAIPDVAAAVVENGTPVAVATASPSTNVPAVPAQIVYPVYPPGTTAPVPAGYIAPPPQQGAAPHFVPPQGTPLYYPPQGVVVHLPEQAGPWNQVVPNTVPEEISPLPPEPPKPVQPGKLPAGWKTAKDSEGNVYYYHTVTRQTQWEPPLAEDADMELEMSAFEEPRKKKGTTTAAADTSSELARRIKEFFRSKMSQFIVQCLNPYRKPDCKLGRISSTDEFKHLARKLTHFVMAKELKHCRNVEDLECNENVKHKAKDFVRKYMSKFGPIYKKTASPKDEDEDDD